MLSWSQGSLGSLEKELCEGKQTGKGGSSWGWVRRGCAWGVGRESPRSRNPTKSPGEEVSDLRAEKPTSWAAGLRWFKHPRNYKPTGFIPNSSSLPFLLSLASWGFCFPLSVPSKGKLLNAGKILVSPAGPLEFYSSVTPLSSPLPVRFHLICAAKMGGGGVDSEYLPQTTSFLCLNVVWLCDTKQEEKIKNKTNNKN